MRKKVLLLLITLIFLLNPFTSHVYAELMSDFESQYEKHCVKETSPGLIAYICSLRNENKQIKQENEELRSRVQELESNIPEEIMLFSEEFNGDNLDSNLWNVHVNGGSITVDNGIITLDTPGDIAVRSPFLQISQVPYFSPPTDPSHVTFEWRMRYNRTGAGTGLILTTQNVDSDSLGNINGLPYVAGTWTSGLLYNHDGTHFFAPVPTDNQFHNYKISFHGLYFYYYLDGVLMETARTFSPYDINSFFIGTPSNAVRSDWSSISVDYFKVTAPTFIHEVN